MRTKSKLERGSTSRGLLERARFRSIEEHLQELWAMACVCKIGGIVPIGDRPAEHRAGYGLAEAEQFAELRTLAIPIFDRFDFLERVDHGTVAPSQRLAPTGFLAPTKA